MCDRRWCRFIREPTTAKYRTLPHGRPLTNEPLQIDIKKLFDKYKHQAEKLSRLSSSQANESFNNTVASKAPKSHHYSGSESLKFRVSAAVSQKNIGHNYVVKVS